MKNGHLSDEKIQGYSIDVRNLNEQEQAHFSMCRHCQSVAAQYKLLFTEMAEITAPVFEFDLATIVMDKIHTAAATNVPGEIKSANAIVFKDSAVTEKKRVTWPLIVVSLVAVLVLGIAIYFLRDYFENMIAGASLIITYMVIITVILIMGFLGFEEYRKYNKQINSLNF